MKVIHDFGSGVDTHERGGLMTRGRAETGGCVPGRLWLVPPTLSPSPLSPVR